MECSGTRGALNGACINALAESSFWVAYSTFSDNMAHQFGGAIYVDVPIVRPPLFENISCMNNEAGYAGGCLYFHTSKQLRSAEWIGNNIYSQNIAQSYGNDIASPLYGVKYDLQIQYQDGKMTIFNASSNSIPKLELYPGQVISSMQVSVWNNGQERIHFLDSEISTLKFSLNDSSS
ncbi:hypothetical protein C9374_002740 [Naegleria lovaniensis]|uniref:Uncharacterized protein n=1 Tax=Naegleria lovaniensis TaxID=51637 RepID=A0AA88GUB1_NAELO|nr:uncharacterized protein C9374_002740 [Naegleria lovaniensis]KAG2386294.1 hypothetical protein C9374_002740 [Naegleria lovaniensis]